MFTAFSLFHISSVYEQSAYKFSFLRDAWIDNCYFFNSEARLSDIMTKNWSLLTRMCLACPYLCTVVAHDWLGGIFSHFYINCDLVWSVTRTSHYYYRKSVFPRPFLFADPFRLQNITIDPHILAFINIYCLNCKYLKLKNYISQLILVRY